MLGASLDEKYENGNDVTVIEPLLGTSIDNFANAIMQNKKEGIHIITQFNDFKIDCDDFKNAEEIIEAYERHIENQIDKKNETKLIQKKITPAEIEDVVAKNSRNLQIISETSNTKQLIKADEKDKNVEIEKE